MSDLIERLRYAEWLWPASPPDDGTYAEAADEIERLTAQVESLQNKWASRELSQQDSDALMAENRKLQARVEKLEGVRLLAVLLMLAWLTVLGAFVAVRWTYAWLIG